MEKLAGIEIEQCTAWLGDESLQVLGECKSSGSPQGDYRELQVIVYDQEGDVIARDYTNWTEFGGRQSFKIEIERDDLPTEPTLVKVYPAKN